jgi:hypothetical protein
VHRHIEKFAQCAEEGGYEFRASVRCDVGRNTVFGENVNEEEPSELNRCNMPITSKQDNLLGCTVNNDTNAIKLTGIWEEFNEVDGYRMPRTKGDRKGTKKAVRFMPRGLVALAVGAGFAIIPDEVPHLGPCVFTPDKSQCTVLSKMAGEYVIMLML